MNTNKNGVGHSQCHPRRLLKKLEQLLQQNDITITTKRQRMIAALICASNCGCAITRFDAEWFGDHCFNTTISEIGMLDGIEVSRNATERPTRFGKPAACKEYYLNDLEVDRALNYLIAIGGA